MVRHSLLSIMCVALVIGGVWTAQAVSQQGPPPEVRRQRGGRRQFDPEEFRRRMEERRKEAVEQMREDLGASQDEWKKVLQPRIEKVQTLAQRLMRRRIQAGMRGMMGGFGRRGGRWSGQEAREQSEQTEVEKATAALRKLLDNKESKAESIKAALGVLRKAQEKTALELAKARKALRDVVSLRQEAQLVLMGLLD